MPDEYLTLLGDERKQPTAAWGKQQTLKFLTNLRAGQSMGKASVGGDASKDELNYKTAANRGYTSTRTIENDQEVFGKKKGGTRGTQKNT